MLILAAILDFFQKRGLPYWSKLPTDLADFQWQIAEENFLPRLRFWGKSKQNCDHESALEKMCKVAAMTSSRKQNIKTTAAFGLSELALLTARGLRPHNMILAPPPLYKIF